MERYWERVKSVTNVSDWQRKTHWWCGWVNEHHWTPLRDDPVDALGVMCNRNGNWFYINQVRQEVG